MSDVEARADNRVNEALSSVLESEVKTQCIVKSVVHSSNRKIAKISRRANKMIDRLQADSVTLQNQMKSTHAADLATLKMKYTSVLKDQQSQLQMAKIQFKSTIREQQRKHSVPILSSSQDGGIARPPGKISTGGCVYKKRSQSRKSN